LSWLSVAALAVTVPAAGAAVVTADSADDLRVPRFAIAASRIGLRGDVRPRQYLGVVGRKAAWLGAETGEAELWVHPLKLANAFHLDFKIPDYDEPLRGADVARTVEVRPELATITYSHATFTVREHILAPLSEPGLLVLLEVDTYRPLEIRASFRSVFQYAWPGALGGQYVFWDASEKAFVFSESRQKTNGLVGSPWATDASSHPAHALPDAPSRFAIPVAPERAARELVPIAVVAAEASRAEVAGLYRGLIKGARALYEERVAHARTLRETLVTMKSPEPRLDLALEWAKADLDDQVVCNPDLGCGLVAGYGPSGESLRPGFGWFFGGDAAINSFAMSSLGESAAVADGLRFLARYQRKDGKIPHEVSQSAARIPWFTDFPYAYYHADTTPYWLVALHRHWRATGDGALLKELWPAAKKAWTFCLSADTDGDGLMENTAAGLGAIEVGDIGSDIHQDVYLAAVSAEALAAMKEMAGAMGERALADDAERRRARAAAALDREYWLPEAGHHAFGVLRSGKTNDTLTVWPATAAAFSLLDRERAGRTLAQLASHRLTADWGTRMLTTESLLYDPIHYNMGGVWPFVTGFLAWGHYNYGRPWAGYPLVDALARMTFDFARGRHPELLSGAYYRPLDTAVPQQFFATSMLVTPLLSGLLGWQPDAPRGEATLAPRLPPQWPRLEVERLPVGNARVHAVFERNPGRLVARLSAEGGTLRLRYRPALPPGARNVRVEVDGQAAAAASETGEVVLDLGHDATGRTAAFAWDDGLEPEPPTTVLEPGQTDDGLRILDFRAGEGGWTALLEGRGGRSYELALRGAALSRVEGGEVVAREGDRTLVRVRFPPSAPLAESRLLFAR
jgi:glycogen debranching enzyme